jgi:hypothetical protein
MKGDARAVAALLHAADAVVLDDEFLGNVVDPGHELDDEVAAAATADTGGKIVEGVEHRDSIEHAQIGVPGEPKFQTGTRESRREDVTLTPRRGRIPAPIAHVTYLSVVLQRIAAAFFAMSWRCFGLNVAARAFPPKFPPRRPISCINRFLRASLSKAADTTLNGGVLPSVS